ncbi:MAG: hypothetical protein Q9166_005786 [cf. Caloplaca sp. 2 TL-2023]
MEPRTSSQSPRHVRSLSHPLTSLLGHSKKTDNRHRTETNLIDTGIQNNPICFSHIGANTGDYPSIPQDASMLKAQDLELVSGRCTICLMINDLRPMERQPLEHMHRQNGKPTGLSLNMTKQIIHQCILLHLQSFIPSDGQPGRSGHKNISTYHQRPVQNDMNKDNVDTKKFSIASLDLNDACGRSTHRHERQQQHLDLPSLPSSWPTRSLQAGFESSTPIGKSLPSRYRPSISYAAPDQPSGQRVRTLQNKARDYSHLVFRPLEDYIVRCFRSCDHLNESFSISKPAGPIRSISEGTMTALNQVPRASNLPDYGADIFELDAKTLLLGDVAENGAWWLGRSNLDLKKSQTIAAASTGIKDLSVSAKPPRTDWEQLHGWYQAILNAGQDWQIQFREHLNDPMRTGLLTVEDKATVESDIRESCIHLHRTLLKATEALLRRPGRPLKNPRDCRFLLLLLANPLLYSVQDSDEARPSRKPGHTGSRGHTGIIKRIFGLMANVPQVCHRQIVSCIARYTDYDLRNLVDLVGRFVTHRLMRQRRRSQGSPVHDPMSVLIPQVSGPGAGISAQLHAALGPRARPASPEMLEKRVMYHDDWQIKAAAKVMSLLFLANNSAYPGRHECGRLNDAQAKKFAHTPQNASGPTPAGLNSMSKAALRRAHRHGQLLPTSAFYNTFLDYYDLVADYEAWENRRECFSFCQYPMFLSLWAKIRILEHDARRQMEIRARQAFFNSITSRSAVSQYLLLRVRRECLVEDSLRGVSEVVGSGQEDIKKSLRIAFHGEEGVDAGGKEWFLLLVREVFDPEHGMFVYDDDSHYCYFNPNTFETSDQFFLVGVVLGLAIYNSILLDVALPPFIFRKLLASAPTYTGPVTSMTRPVVTHTLADLAEFRPLLASGLQKLLEYDGDVQNTFCRDFVIESDSYGQSVQVPLRPNGESQAVTNANRAEFVELYVKYLLDTSVSRQFEPFKRGFFSVCGGNALSLFRPEEIELLVRGSDEPLDIASLRAVAIYDGWKTTESPEEGVIAWFWEIFTAAAAKAQRALLSFITGSDRLPAMGATSLIIKISCLGDDTRRFPMARTCFNMLGLYRYPSKEVLQSRLWKAVNESEGFGLK